jgi:hypothetical protein
MSPIRPSHFLPPPRAATTFAPTRVSFVNAPTQPTATVSKGAQFEVMVPAGYNLKEAAGARQLSSSTLVASPVPGRGGKQGPVGEVQLVMFQASRTESAGSLTFVKEENIGRGGRPMATDVMSFALVLK